MKRILASASILFAMTAVWPPASTADQSEVDPAIASGAATRQFSAARAKWLGAGITDYRFSISASCYCIPSGDVLVTVRGRKKTASSPDWYGPRSVPALFKVVHTAITGQAASLVVRYDRTTGRPRFISIDRSRQIADEEIAYTVKAFRRL